MPAKLEFQKRIAADLMKCGVSRVRFDLERLDEVAEAITREDVRKLIEDGVIYKVHEKGVSRVRAREREEKGRGRGSGSRKGEKYSIVTRKERWILKVRAQKKKLKELRDKRLIERSTYRKIYGMVKAGAFKSVRDMLTYLESNKLIRRTIL
ncbi:MAG: 50S ribosomal protein L19e [Aigarchaeota archaeon]|nr:50S ribosomal protein L19e [Aigarchaeota archaeon]MCX8193079.1 50S ribosomal protein L19e [Nitrososphaeria archaeon]MDW7986928.1 50S ribosomal protein L19e [Nitrososphaerota archaeon]